MADIHQRVEAEFENIEKLLSELPAGSSYSQLSVLERAGLATVIHNFYNGIENVLKQIIRHRGIETSLGTVLAPRPGEPGEQLRYYLQNNC